MSGSKMKSKPKRVFDLIKKNLPMVLVFLFSLTFFILGLITDKGPFDELSAFLDSVVGKGNWRIRAVSYEPDGKVLSLKGLSIALSKKTSITIENAQVTQLTVEGRTAAGAIMELMGVSLASDRNDATAKLSASYIELRDASFSLNPEPIFISQKILFRDLKGNFPAKQTDQKQTNQELANQKPTNLELANNARNIAPALSRLDFSIAQLSLKLPINIGPKLFESDLPALEADKLSFIARFGDSSAELRLERLTLGEMEKFKTVGKIQGGNLSISHSRLGETDSIAVLAAGFEFNELSAGRPIARPSPAQLFAGQDENSASPLGLFGETLAALLARSWSLKEANFSDLNFVGFELFPLQIGKAGFFELSNAGFKVVLDDLKLENPKRLDSSEGEKTSPLFKLVSGDEITGQISSTIDYNYEKGEIEIAVKPIKADNLLLASSSLKVSGFTLPWLTGQKPLGVGLVDGPRLVDFKLSIEDLAVDRLLSNCCSSNESSQSAEALFSDAFEMGLTIRFDNLLENTKQISEAVRDYLNNPKNFTVSLNPTAPMTPQSLAAPKGVMELIKELSVQITINDSAPITPQWRDAALGFDKDYTSDDSGMYPKND